MREFWFAVEGVGIEPAHQGVRPLTEPFDQGAKEILPPQQPVREEIEAGLPLDLEPAIDIRGESGIHGGGIGAPAVQPAGCFHDLLGPGIEAMLIGKNLDRQSLSITGLRIG